MRDRLLIFTGLFIFLALFTFPIWSGVAADTSTAGPVLLLPGNKKTCVAPVEYMRTSHMKLLIRWRNSVVREHQHYYTAYNGDRYRISLTETCLGQCHGSKKEFCDRCHEYVAIPAPHCWECHQDVKARTAAVASAAAPGRMP